MSERLINKVSAYRVVMLHNKCSGCEVEFEEVVDVEAFLFYCFSCAKGFGWIERHGSSKVK